MQLEDNKRSPYMHLRNFAGSADELPLNWANDKRKGNPNDVVDWCRAVDNWTLLNGQMNGWEWEYGTIVQCTYMCQ